MGKKFNGNFMFASIQSCQNFNQSRKDDIESLFHIVVFLLNDNDLPWRDLAIAMKVLNVDQDLLLEERVKPKYIRKYHEMIP